METVRYISQVKLIPGFFYLYTVCNLAYTNLAKEDKVLRIVSLSFLFQQILWVLSTVSNNKTVQAAMRPEVKVRKCHEPEEIFSSNLNKRFRRLCCLFLCQVFISSFSCFLLEGSQVLSISSFRPLEIRKMFSGIRLSGVHSIWKRKSSTLLQKRLLHKEEERDFILN